MFEAAGLGQLVVRELGLGDPDVEPDLDSWRALVARIKAPKPVLEIAPRRQVHRAARRLPLGHRGAPPRRLGARGRRQGPLGRFRGAHRTRTSHERLDGVGRRSSSRAASAIAASRARSSPPTTPATTASRTSACASGLQCAVIEFARDVVGSDGRQLDRVRHVHRAPGHRLHARPARHGGQGRHDAPGPVPGQADARLEGRARSTARRSSTSGIATASRSTTATARRSRRPGMILSGQSPGRPPRRDRRARATTRGSWPASSTRSSRAGRSARTRCSTASSRRRSPSRRPRAGLPGAPGHGVRPKR